jgi:aminoglycoside phosphotransferase (APT) family kinase protein
VLHNDFHTGNMVFSAPAGELTGIWDFTCVQRGEPAYDLRYLDGAPRDVLDRVAGHYERLTGRAVDAAAARVANRMEDVFDAVETGRPALLEAAAARWARTDSGR